MLFVCCSHPHSDEYTTRGQPSNLRTLADCGGQRLNIQFPNKQITSPPPERPSLWARRSDGGSSQPQRDTLTRRRCSLTFTDAIRSFETHFSHDVVQKAESRCVTLWCREADVTEATAAQKILLIVVQSLEICLWTKSTMFTSVSIINTTFSSFSFCLFKKLH